MGLRAAFVSNSTSAAFLAESAGFHSLDVLDCGKAPTQPADYAVHKVFGLPSAGRVAKQLIFHLGVESASTQPTAPTRIDVREEHDNELDLLLLHIDAHAAMLSATTGTRDTAATPSETIATTESLMPQDTEVARCPASRPHSADPIEASCSCLEWLDDLLLALNESKEVRSQVLLCLVLGSQGDPLGQILEEGGRELEPWTAQAENARGCGSQQGGQLPKLVRPRQSFQFCGLDYVEADLQLPLLTVCRCKGVVRCDCVQRVDVGDARALGGDAAILVDRLLYGIAYTMGKATKYGA
ncbi:unnamed protein product [Ostreobium quekettii]|uniref:Uncharacterized protein n=1 Tax=Ostreobium quekettii TaxID=121088 RepID=A0A8S1IZ88_9CHLO|nr:unnamed protein product [Ostreobium quekettii]